MARTTLRGWVEWLVGLVPGAAFADVGSCPQITVGNEYILDNDVAGTTTSSAYTTAVNYLLTQVKSVNTTIQGLSLSKHLPIGTSDAGSLMSTSLATGIEYFMANVHP
jgi:glucan 1,3-beta-glucosidase